MATNVDMALRRTKWFSLESVLPPQTHSFLCTPSIGNLFRTKNDLFMRLYEVSMARNYFDFGSVSYDVGSGDAFHDHTAWHTHSDASHIAALCSHLW